TREPGARFWLCRFADGVVRVLDRQAFDALLNENSGVLLLLRLGTWLIDLEQKTQDHASEAEIANAFSRRDTESAQDLIEEAMRRELTAAGLSKTHVGTVFNEPHKKLVTAPPAG